MRRVPLLSFGALFTALAWSCVDFDYLQSGASADATSTPTEDAGNDAGDDVGTDAIADAGNLDAADGPITQPRFCDGSTHALCADFDDADPLAPWTVRSVDNALGAVGISMDRARSGTTSLRASLQRRETDKKRATFGVPFVGAWRRIVVEADVWLEPPAWQSGDSNAGIIAVEFFSSGASAGAYISVGQSYTTAGTVNDEPMPTGAWVHVKLDVDPASQIRAEVGNRKWTSAFSAPTAGTSPSINVGVGVDGFNAPAPTFVLYFDNVTVDLP